VDYDKTLAAIQNTVDGYPGLQRDVQTYLKERIKEVLTGSSDAVVVRISGPDLHVLQSQAEAWHSFSGTGGIVDLKSGSTLTPQVEVRRPGQLNPGINPVMRRVIVLMSGEEVGDIYVGGKTYDVNVWSTPETRKSLTNIRELLIDTPAGGHVRLADVADVRIVPAPNVIEREGQSRKTDVSANVRGRDLGAVVRDVEAALKTVEFPLEYHAELFGEYAERQAAQRSILIIRFSP
jgi:Cu/Ag efflux pump CusA